MKRLLRKPSPGFTLIELVVVIAVLAVLTAILAPQFVRYVEKARAQVCDTNLHQLANAYSLHLILNTPANHENALNELMAEVGLEGVSPGAAVRSRDGEGPVVPQASQTIFTIEHLCPSRSKCYITIDTINNTVVKTRCGKHGETVALSDMSVGSQALADAIKSAIEYQGLTFREKTIENIDCLATGENVSRINAINAALNAAGLKTGPDAMWRIVYNNSEGDNNGKFCVIWVQLNDEQKTRVEAKETVNIEKNSTAYRLFFNQDGELTYETEGFGATIKYGGDDYPYMRIEDTVPANSENWKLEKQP
ncbi:MAG: prepilin-type N-terminal cleavage/methylation domain-containing protein [Syntrophomonadaceae bacterium]|nr:prepilin-type N-terminal cleavage/methylation domain-containing protein [Syntrophomonadaceae bacterium]